MYKHHKRSDKEAKGSLTDERRDGMDQVKESGTTAKGGQAGEGAPIISTVGNYPVEELWPLDIWPVVAASSSTIIR
jgi:hypothetical protein